MNTALIELAATTLGNLVDDVIFVGGATVELWITDPAAPPVRATIDIDVVIEATTQSSYHAFGKRLKQKGFREDHTSKIAHRWKHDNSGLILDVLSGFGSSNRWLTQLPTQSARYKLPSGTEIHTASTPHLLATKIEAFLDRGNNDFSASKDFADIITLIDGREEITTDVNDANPDIKTFLSEQLAQMSNDPRFEFGIQAQLPPDPASQQRGTTVVLPRIKTLISLT